VLAELIWWWKLPEARKIKILFAYSHLQSFVRRDLEMLKRHFAVKGLKITTFKNPLNIFRLFIEIIRVDVVYTWFASTIAFFSVLFSMCLRKKSLIVVGGYDVVYIPEIDYGKLKSSFGRLQVKFVLNHASKILPFSNYAKKRVLSITKKAKVCMIPLACDTHKFRPSSKQKENLAITVCVVKENNIKRKGLKTFIESAKLLPKVKFAIIGPHEDNSINYLRKISPQNVEFTGYVTDEELVRWYQRAKVYCQLSYEEGEGAGGALGEAMACECIPVVSEKAVALRETVDNCGFYVPYGNAGATAKAISQAINSSATLGEKARKRMLENFSIKKRETQLVKIVEDLLARH